MKQAAIVLGGALAMFLATAPGFAQTTHGTTGGSTATPAEKPSGSTAAPAEKPSKLSMPHHVTGAVVSADQSGKSLTVKDSKGKEFTFMADSDAAAQMGSFKQGDRVKVTYKKSHGQMVATKIAQAESTKAAK